MKQCSCPFDLVFTQYLKNIFVCIMPANCHKSNSVVGGEQGHVSYKVLLLQHILCLSSNNGDHKTITKLR